MRQFSIPYTPQQNNVIEYMNRTFLDITGVMLGTIGVLKFLEKVVNIA